MAALSPAGLGDQHTLTDTLRDCLVASFLGRYMKTCWANLDVVGGRMVLGVVIGMICLAWFPMHSELALLDSVVDPEEVHVHCFGAFDVGGLCGWQSLLQSSHQLAWALGQVGDVLLVQFK